MPESCDKLLEIDIPTINFFPKNQVNAIKLSFFVFYFGFKIEKF
ncbi:hypothetical protein SAMN04488057_1301 [Cyclobacterium lianum]|uniref:Uncharacterized protein n=1 Tax=Cyclobacterium lianum TaxID=388280 RepID=A0A1M7QW79_9BACT|nr:hypothetical protein SAMN04488057_1301 [Cyclobacterium lianum]